MKLMTWKEVNDRKNMITRKDIKERQQKPYIKDSGNQRLKNFEFQSYEEFMNSLDYELEYDE